MNELFISELLAHNIKLCRECNNLEEYKADIADGLCGIELAMNEVSTPRIKELLEIAKGVIVMHHFYVGLMADVEPINE